MNIQYFHGRNYYDHFREVNSRKELEFEVNPRGGVTVAMEEVQPWLFQTLEVGNSFEKLVGVARCSLDDNYNKKTGRELSTLRMKKTQLKVISVYGRDTKEHIIVLKDNNGSTYLLTKHGDANRVYFQEYNDA